MIEAYILKAKILNNMSQKDELRILFTGGGTGGHIFPIVAVARELKKLALEQGVESLQFYFLGPNGFAKKELEAEDIVVYRLPAGKLHRFLTWRIVLEIPKIILGFLAALWRVWQIMPDVTWAKGGFGSFNPAFVTWLYHEPLILHDSDSVPGLTNRLLKYLAARIGIAFPGAAKYFPARKTALVGNPIRHTIVSEIQEEVLPLHRDRPVILIWGGSSGAQSINDLIAQALFQLLDKFEIIHQVGSQNLAEYKKLLRTVYNINPDQPHYHLFGFLNEQQVAYALQAADLVISRAGANSIYEIAAAGKPSILIPLPTAASNHQQQNAFEYARFGAAIVLESANLRPNLLVNEIENILNNPQLHRRMSEAAQNFAKEDAAYQVAQEILEVALAKRS